MHFLRSVTSFTRLIVLALMITALAVSLHPDSAVDAHPIASLHHAPSATCYGATNACWYIETQDFKSGTNNYLTGIEDGGNLVGATSSNNCTFNSLWADPSPSPTAYPSYAPENDPNYQSTFLQGLSNNGSQGGAYQVGYANSGCGSGTTVGVIYYNGNWYTVQDTDTGSCGVTQVLAMNDEEQGVGFYLKPTNGTCEPQAFEFYPQNPKDLTSFNYHDFSPPHSQYLSSTANGINSVGDVVGTVTYGTKSSPHREAWVYSELGYYTFGNGSDDTDGRGIDFNDRIVGDYVDTSGTHGFFVKNPQAPQFVQIDFKPRTSGPVTIINSINTAYSIAGWYLGPNYYHGFVGICTTQCPNVPAPSGRERHRLKAVGR